MKSKELAHLIAELAQTKKALDVCIMDIKGLSDVADFFVICTGQSDTQVKAIADAISDGVIEHGSRVWRKEGMEYLQWALLDFVDVVVHVFQPAVREYYDIERLWGDAKTEIIEDKP